MTAADFLARHWQRVPLMNVAALTTLDPFLSPAELAWLATQDDVESRLIFTTDNGAGATYRLESGPFDDAMLATLPERDWTLLVQDVEKHLPDFRAWLAQVAFIPDWRVDDIMISFAVPGGSTGPHRDRYDVFLCQVLGRREWRLAAQSLQLRDVQHAGLALLQPFDDPAPQHAAPGDVLYLPPGLAHWGIARDRCMTLSIGMRAPTRDELRLAFARAFPSEANPFPGNAEPEFYADPGLQADEAVPGAISQAAIARCRALCAPSAEVSDDMLGTTLGCTVTDLKAWLEPDCPGTDDIASDLGRSSDDDRWPVHGMSRIAWTTSVSRATGFANGHWRSLDEQELLQMQAMCRDRSVPVHELRSAAAGSLLQWLLQLGVVAPLHAG